MDSLEVNQEQDVQQAIVQQLEHLRFDSQKVTQDRVVQKRELLRVDSLAVYQRQVVQLELVQQPEHLQFDSLKVTQDRVVQ